jgi:phosphatidylcholine synthase
MNLFSAWLVHLYTASGILAAFFGSTAVFAGRYREAFLWMAAATFVDATDGALARLALVKERLPGFDGARLDDIVDYATFVFLPVLLLYHSGALPPGWGGVVAGAVLISSAYGFSAADAKSHDHFFTGFPSYWNIVALYLYVLRLGPVTNAVVLLTLSGMVFWRVKYVYPTRTPVLRPLTLTLASLWGMMIVAMILALSDVPPALTIASLVFPLYYVALSIALHFRH